MQAGVFAQDSIVVPASGSNRKSGLGKARRWLWVASLVAFDIFLAFRVIRAHHRPVSPNEAAYLFQDVRSFRPAPGAPAPKPGSHVMALARAPQGRVWIGTEDDGVFCYDPNAAPEKQWSSYTTNDGLGDNNGYSIACDKQGRVWVGELNHGVAVFDGRRWTNYDVLAGPVGERVFRIAVCPTDGDVWLATSAGLTRYSVAADTWRCYTRADGLPGDQANGLAFDAKGNLYAGTQCDGIAIGLAAGGYQQWRVIPGPDQLPAAAVGSGLPSALINDLVVTRDQKIFAATTAGLAFSTNAGKDWQYIRGRDYAAKVQGLPDAAPPGEARPAPNDLAESLLLPEDFVTCLAEDRETNIWMGFRREGYAVFNPGTGKIEFHATQAERWLADNFVTALLPSGHLEGYAGTYGSGLMMPWRDADGDGAQDRARARKAAALPRFPSPAKPLGAAELTALADKIRSLPIIPTNAFASNRPSAVYLGQDWRTLGDWTGRYGRQHAILSGMSTPLDQASGWGYQINYAARMGPHHDAGDSLRYWAGHAWLKTTDPRALYSPAFNHRRITEWDDHGETYPMTYQGPDIWVQVGVPEGVFRVALYFVNYNGHYGMERFRDYFLEMKTCSNSYGGLKGYSNAPPEWEKLPVLTRGRVQNFWGGVYQCFVVTGPAQYALKIGRNYSFNTMCQGLFVDRLLGPAFATADNSWLPYMEHVRYQPPHVPLVDAKGEPPGLLAARGLWSALDDALTTKQGIEMQNELRLQSYRVAANEHAAPALLSNWRWKMPLWTPEDRAEYVEAMQWPIDIRRGLHPDTDVTIPSFP